MRKIIPSFLATGLLALPISLVSTPGDQQGQDKQSSYFHYSGYSQPQYRSFSKRSQFVAMPDGVRLAVDILLPQEGPNAGPFPAAFSFTPYDRSWVDLKTGESTDSASDSFCKQLLAHGYAVVAADMRGTGASFGMQVPFSTVIGNDGKALVDWIAVQPWSNGKVGMFGQSYLGWSQLATARNQPKALKCIIPEVICFEGYSEGFRPGGIEASNWIISYSQMLTGLNLNKYQSEAGLAPAVPVIDEDGDGLFTDEIPLMDRGDPTTFLDDGFPPRYADGQTRSKHYFFLATREHLANPTFAEIAKTMPFIDSVTGASPRNDFSYLGSSPGSWIPEIAASGVAVYHLGGWFDGFAKGTTKLYATMQGRLTEKLLMAPRFHMPYVTKAYSEYFGYGEDLERQLNTERLRFFDRYLKGIANGIEREPPVYIYVMNSGWRTEEEWPPERRVSKTLYFAEKSRLTSEKKGEGIDEYQVDFTHSALYGANGSDRFLMMTPPDQMMLRTEKDKKCLIYETEPLTEPVEVTGHPVIELWVSANRPGCDFFVYLVDVDDKGQALHVTEGCLRSGWRASFNDDEQIPGIGDIRPDLPWHGYRQAQWINGRLDAPEPVKIRFDLFPTSWLFRKGHRLRVSIAGSDFPNFSLNPGLAPHGKPEECPETKILVHRSIRFGSRLELPTIPVK